MAWSDWASAVGSGASSLISGLFGNSQQKKQNKFAAEQAELDRQFQAEQAQLANEFTTSERLASQQWEEDWYNNYSSPQAMVSQYEEAGLNPALMYGAAGSSTGETPSAPSGESGAYASGSKATPLQGLSALDYLQFAVDAFDKIIGSFGRIKENRHKDIENSHFDEILTAQHKVLEAEEKEKLSNVIRNNVMNELDKVSARLKQSDIDLNVKRGSLIDKQIDEIESSIRRNDKLNSLSDAEINKLSAETLAVKQLVNQRGALFPTEKEMKEIGLDKARMEKDFDFFIPQILNKYDSEYWLTLAKESESYANRRLTDAECEKIMSEKWYQDFCNTWARETGMQFGKSYGVVPFLTNFIGVLAHSLNATVGNPDTWFGN